MQLGHLKAAFAHTYSSSDRVTLRLCLKHLPSFFTPKRVNKRELDMKVESRTCIMSLKKGLGCSIQEHDMKREIIFLYKAQTGALAATGEKFKQVT